MDKENTNASLDFDLPVLADFLKAGVQFGHQSKRWNPKMQEYIFGEKKGIHVIDVSRTYESLQKALGVLLKASSQGNVLFVGTKRQARTLIRESAIEAGAFFITHRWVGGLLTNMKSIKTSLRKLEKLEEDFEKGIEGRTKFEVSRMKKEWERLNRLYEGVKDMEQKPTMMVVLDSKYEKNAIKEANKINVPVISIVDTNCDPDRINYPIPGNDDAIASIKLFFDLFVKAVKQGNKGKGVQHTFKDYSNVDVQIRKSDEEIESEDVQTEVIAESKPKVLRTVVTTSTSKTPSQGILEGVQKAKEEKTITTAAKELPAKSRTKKVVKVAKKVKKAQKSNQKVSVISPRTETVLKKAKLTLKKAQKMTREQLLEVDGIGPKVVDEILKA